MNDIIERNRDLLQRRWPAIWSCIEAIAADDLPTLDVVEERVVSLRVSCFDLGSRYDPRAEAEMQAEPIPEDSIKAWLYGVGLGYVPMVLLERTQLECLHVVIMNPALFRATLTSIDHREWLDDKRVSLHLGRDEQEVHFPFCVIPPCLELVEDPAARLRDIVVLELNTPFINEQFAVKAKGLIDKIETVVDLISADQDVDTVVDSLEDGMALVVAAGPSLDKQIKKIRQLRPTACLIAVDGSLRPLLNAGLVPDFVVTVDDADENIGAYFEGELSALSKSKLVYFPIVARCVLESWPGERLVAYGDTRIYGSIAEKIPHSALFTAGSVLHVAVDFAALMKPRQIILFGADFAFPGGRYYADSVNREVRDNEFKSNNCWVYNGKGEKIATQQNLRGYLRDLERYIAAHPEIEFINAGKEGAQIQGAKYQDSFNSSN